MLAVRNITKFSPALFQRDPDARHDWEILLELETRIKNPGLRGAVKRKLMQHFLGPDRLIDLGLRFGPYGGKLNPFANGLTLKKVKQAKHGIDLGPLIPCLPDRLCTADKQIELAPEVLVKDVARVKTRLLEAAISLTGTCA